MSHRILVTGATGNAGTEVIKELQKRDPRIVAASRRQAEAGRPEDGAEVVYLDMNKPASYAAAVQGCDALFLLRPPSVANTKETFNVLIDEARKAGMRRIVFVSVAGAGDNKLVPHHATEQHLKAGHDDWTILRPGFFAQNIATACRQDIVEHDRIYLPAGNGKAAFIDLRRDMGVVAAEALADLDHHGGETYTLTGPQAYTFYQVASILSDALARAIRYDPASTVGYYRHLRRRKMNRGQIFIQTVLHVGLRFGQAETVDSTLERLLGYRSHDVEQYIRDHAGIWSTQEPTGEKKEAV